MKNKMNNKIKDGQLRVWWIPQVPQMPMKPFYAMVNNLEEAKYRLNFHHGVRGI